MFETPTNVPLGNVYAPSYYRVINDFLDNSVISKAMVGKNSVYAIEIKPRIY